MKKPISLQDFSVQEFSSKTKVFELLKKLNQNQIELRVKDIDNSSDSEEIVLKINKDENNKNYIFKTFDYVGTFSYQEIEFEIKYGDSIRLKDFSIREIDTSFANFGKLTNHLKEVNSITLDTSLCDVVGESKDIEPILQIKKLDEDKLLITTFGYVGRFSYLGIEFDITYRFGEKLLNRMISKVNSFEVKELKFDAKNKKTDNEDSLALLILYTNFILKLEKLSVLGLPKSYQRLEHHDNKLRGQLDINRFIKKDIPFQGKISSTSYEQVYVQEIVDVLYGAMINIEKRMPHLVGERIFGVRNLIYHHANRQFVDEKTIENALYHKSIQNSLYGGFKNIIEIASYIIRHDSSHVHHTDNKYKGLIFDVSLLWESYLYKILKDNIEDENWKVAHEDAINVYDEKFYRRKMKPDIIIKNENTNPRQIIVLDAKSKSMEYKQGIGDGSHGDLDRSDFFQINTYMSYYHNNKYQVIAGGLLYPINLIYDKSKCYSDNWLGGTNTKFIVDGIELYKAKSNKSIVCREKQFVQRIKDIIVE